jgi:glycosyltransferase involved in cell wall biosynthesis
VTEQPRRVLLLIKGLGRGGAEHLLTSTIRHSDRSRFSYDVAYLLPWKDEIVADLQELGVVVHCLDGARGIGWVGRLRNLVRTRSVDLVHVHSPYAAIGARVGLPRTMPFVYTEHNLWQRYRAATHFGNALTFPRNDHVIAVSEQVRRSISYPWALRRLRMPPVETVYHGVDHPGLAELGSPNGLRSSLGLPEDAPIVGTVANLKAHKGHRHLLRAAVRIRRSCPDVRFVLVGRGPLEGELRRQARELGLDGGVVFTGYRDDAARLASSFDVFVLPSEYEGLPIALVEAMALGRPVVVTAVGGNPEVVRDQQDGLVVPARSPEALADAVLTLLRDDALRLRLGDAARARSAEFDIARTVPQVERIYEGLLG